MIFPYPSFETNSNVGWASAQQRGTLHPQNKVIPTIEKNDAKVKL
jgi:hypothetical protein